MHTYRETEKSYYAELQAQQVCKPRKKNETTKNVKLLKFELEETYSLSNCSDVKLILTDDQLSPEQFDKAAHEAMLAMLSIEPTYYFQISKSYELV